MNITVLRLKTNTAGDTVAETKVFKNSRQAAEVNYHEQLADCAKQGRPSDAVVMLNETGGIIKGPEFYIKAKEVNVTPEITDTAETTTVNV